MDSVLVMEAINRGYKLFLIILVVFLYLSPAIAKTLTNLDAPQILPTNPAAPIEYEQATAFLYAGQFAQAQQQFDRLILSESFSNNPELQTLVYNDLGNLASYQGNNSQALAFYRQSTDLAASQKDISAQLRALVNAVSIAQRIGETKQAEILFAEAMRLLPDLGKAQDQALILYKLGKAMQFFARDREIYTAYVGLLTKQLETELEYIQKSINSHDASLLLGALSGLYAQAEQYQDALTYSERAAFAAQQVGDLGQLYQWQWQQARLYKRLDRPDDALRAYRLAVQSLAPIKDRMTDNKFSKGAGIELNDGAIYLEFADLLLKSTDSLQSSSERQQRLSEARRTLEMQKEAELQDYFHDSCLFNAKGEQNSIDESIDSKTAVIYPILLEDRTELLVSFKDGIQRFVVEKTAREVSDQVHQLRAMLEKRRTRDYLPYAQRLYRWLIAPIEAELNTREIHTLVMVSGQSLRAIPWSVFHDGEQFLVNRFALATTPGITLTDARPLKRDHMRVLLSGITESVQGYPALRYVRGELEEIQDLYVGKLLLNRDFITRNLSSAMQSDNYSVAHIASHSVFTGDVQGSYILTFDGRLTMNQLGRLASVGRQHSQPIELITLSACQTAAGDDRAALGLAGVAIKAGARSALATLWSINDQASSMLVTEFYRQLQNPSISKAEALQRAQNKLMRNVRYRHPGYWSPFLLIGNWL